MRDLPPQAQGLDLEQPAPTFLDLPVLETATAVLLPAPEVARPLDDDGPPPGCRPHAAPVGVVRILS